MAGSQRGATPQNRDLARHHEDEVARLRTRERLTWAQIAEQVGCNERTARRAWTRVRAESNAEAQQAIDAWRAEMLATCEAVIDGLMAAALKGDPRAAEAIVKTVERTSRLLGLDAPLKASVTVTDEMTARIKALAEELAEA